MKQTNRPLSEEVRVIYKKPKNLRERFYKARMNANLFGGPVLTAAGTIAALRHTGFPEYSSPLSEAAYWATSALVSLPFQIVAVPVGIALGVYSSLQLAESRAKKKNKLEMSLNN